MHAVVERGNILVKSINHGKLTAGLLDGPVVKIDNPVKIQDLTFRDGHQSIYATRGRTEDFIPIAEQIDSIGFYSIEMWGGATFDTMHRFLGEDPWERIRTLKKYIKKLLFPCCSEVRIWWDIATILTMSRRPLWIGPVKTAWTSSGYLMLSMISVILKPSFG